MVMPGSQEGRPLRTRITVVLGMLAAVTMVVAVATGTWPRPVSRQATAASLLGIAPLQVGRSAPAFAVPGLTGGQLTLAQYAGHPRVVTFFATSCGQCLGDLAVLEPAYRQYRGRGLVILGIGVEDTAANLRQAASQIGVSFPLGYDDNGDRVARPYGLYSIPMTVFIDVDGIIRAIVQGSVGDAALERNLALILPRAAQ